MMPAIRGNREGMSLIELLITMVIAVIILQVALGFFIGQSRLVGENESRRASRDVTRTAMNVFMADLRRVETGHGVVSASSSVVDMRVPFAVGIVCSQGLLNLTVSLLPTDSVRLASANSDGFAGYAIRTGSGAYGSFQAATALSSGDAGQCVSEGVTVFDNAYVREMAKHALVIPSAGAQVLLYDRIRYEFESVDDELFLMRTVNGGDKEPLVGPFDPEETRFRFYTAGSSVAVDAPPSPLSDMRGLEVALHGLGDRPRAGSGAVSTAPLTASVFFKNRP